MRAFDPSNVPKPARCPPFSIPSRPLDIEVGCGVGWHPITYARANPDRFLVAIEHTTEKFSKFERRLERHPGLENLLPVHANAISWITHQIPPASVERYFILYPNLADRWAKLPFMEYVVATLKAGGQLTLATNDSSYAAEAEKHMQSDWGLKSIEKRTLVQGNLPEGFPRTHFEKKYLERGEKCLNLVFQKS